MSDNQNLTWRAMCELGDYFSRLGGTARPPNMAESEIQLFIANRLLEINNVAIDENKYSNQAFLKAAKPVIEKANSYLLKIELSESELFPFVLDFYEYANEKLNEIDKTTRWQKFGEYLRDENA